jgi:2-iminobutanoate/2-iminopropanoate deaminase
MGALPLSPFIAKGGFVFTSGQVCLTEEGKLLDGTVEEQTKQVMNNLEKVLKDAGVTFEDVVKTTIYTTDMSLYGKINEVYGSYLSKPYPAREVVCVKKLPLEAKLEISMVAFKL